MCDLYHFAAALLLGCVLTAPAFADADGDARAAIALAVAARKTAPHACSCAGPLDCSCPTESCTCNACFAASPAAPTPAAVDPAGEEVIWLPQRGLWIHRKDTAYFLAGGAGKPEGAPTQAATYQYAPMFSGGYGGECSGGT